MEENSVLDLAFRNDYRLNFVEAHSCLQANTETFKLQFTISSYCKVLSGWGNLEEFSTSHVVMHKNDIYAYCIYSLLHLRMVVDCDTLLWTLPSHIFNYNTNFIGH